MFKRVALALVVVLMLVPFVSTVSAEPPPPQPVYQFSWHGEEIVCFGWDGVTWTWVSGGTVVGYMWWYDAYLPVCPIGAEMFDYSDSVVGRFVANTQLLADPDPASGIDVVMEVGKTAWVHGLDASGSFYQISIGAAFAWVPVASMEPNFDTVWNGAPLIVPIVD